MHTKKEIGKALQAMRKSGGYKSASQFADFMGYNAGTYTNWEQGKQTFSFAQAWEMADALDCTLDELGGRVPLHSTSTLEPDESALVYAYRSMDGRGRAAVSQLADTLSRDSASPGDVMEAV